MAVLSGFRKFDRLESSKDFLHLSHIIMAQSHDHKISIWQGPLAKKQVFSEIFQAEKARFIDEG